MDSMSASRPLLLHSSLAPERCIHASGSRYRIGYQQGASHRADIHRFLGDRLTRIGGILARQVSLPEYSRTIGEYAAVIKDRLPDMAEELRGLADGAGISEEEAYLLQLRRELVGYRSVRSRGDCTTFGRLAPGRTVIGQTIDLNGDMAPELTVLRLDLEDTGRRLLLLSFTGLLGYLGMNDRGLAICLNLVLGGTWRPGIPGYMAIRHLLDEASTVEECLERLSGLPLASSRALTITDGRRLVTVEYILDEMVVIEGDELVHANHFLHAGFADRDELNPFARTSSLRRQDACAAALGKLPADTDEQAYLDILAEPTVDVAPNGDIKRECTVGSVVMRPDLGTMFVRQGSATASRTPDRATSSEDLPRSKGCLTS
jgi:isopenicillin-N N-acyltransferase like protein